MSVELEVHACDPDRPEQSTLALARALLSSFPRRRPVTLALVGFAPQPGLTPTPWALDGVLEACVEAERTPLTLLTIADSSTGEALVRKVGGPLLAGAEARELVERPSRDRSASLRSYGQRRPFTIPREVVGSSLLLLTPLLLRGQDRGRARHAVRGGSQAEHWRGPLALALEQLALAWGYAPTPAPLSSGLRARPDDDGREPAAVGLELIAASFASAAVIIDGTWAGALEPVRPATGKSLLGRAGLGSRSSGDAPPSLTELASTELVSPDRCLGLVGLERADLDELLGVDQWLAKALGLTRHDGRLPAPTFSRSPGRWPQLELGSARSQPTRLADRAISGIRSQSQRITSQISSLTSGPGRDMAALPARVPGRFAQQWTSRWYTDTERLGR